MIDYFSGTIDSKEIGSVVLDISGIGYRIFVSQDTYDRILVPGRQAKLYIVQSVSIYGGNTTYYGFFTRDERDLFILIKDEVPGTGAKKSLEYLDKINKSLPDFKRAVIEKNLELLTNIFGFTKKTSEKLVIALKDKISAVEATGNIKWPVSPFSKPLNEAVEGLVALGYKEIMAKAAVEKIISENGDKMAVAEVIRIALRNI